MLRPALAIFTLLSLQLPFAVSAQQSDDEMARHFFETGRTYFDRAQYQEAAEAFAEAYRLSERAALLINQARALEAAGDIPGAIAALERAEQELDEDSAEYPTVAPRLRRLRAQQEQAAAAEAETASTEEDAPEEETREESGHASPPEDVSDDGPGTLFWVGIGTAAFGGAALIVSLATGLAAHGIYGDLEEACPGDVCPPDRAGDIDRGNALSTASTALLFVGAIAAAVGVTLIIVDGAGDDEDDGSAPTAALRIGPASLLVDETSERPPQQIAMQP